METEYVRELKNSYMKIYAEGVLDGSMKMAVSNDIQGLLKITKRSINDKDVYYYDISSMMEMKEYFEEKEMKAADLNKLFQGIKRVVNALEEYLLDPDALILEPDKIFLENNTGEYYFTFYSQNSGSFEENLKTFSEYLIQRVCHTDNEAVTMGYGVYKRLCGGTINFDELFEFETAPIVKEPQIVEEKKIVKEVVPEIVDEEYESADWKKYVLYGAFGVTGLLIMAGILGLFVKSARPAGNMAVSFFMCVGGASLAWFLYKWYQNNKEIFTVIKTRKQEVPYEKRNVRIVMPQADTQSENYTVVLNNSAAKANHYLKWEDRFGIKKYEIKEDVVVIGSARENADCFIDMEGISRRHARLLRDGERFYIKDLNSTNGTRINGRDLACFEVCEINRNDVITFGGLECVFV